MFKKIIISFLILLTFSSTFLATSIKAQESGGTWYNQSYQEWSNKVYDTSNPSEIFGERYTAAQVQWIIYGLFSFIINNITGDASTTNCLITNDLKSCKDGLTNYFSQLKKLAPSEDQSASIPSIILQDRPLSAISYFKDTAKNLHIIPTVEAQTPGFGFGALHPVLDIWRASRNIAYGLFVIVILVLSFMIMFRVKISPQVVISVQSALPKVAIALVLVTFSYAIAGFLVDLMYVVIGLVSLLFSQAYTMMGWVHPPTSTAVFGFLTKGVFGLGIIGLLGMYMVFFALAAIVGLIGINGIGGLTGVGMALVFSFLALLLIIVVLLLLLFICLKIMWMLFKAFATILLLVIAAPFQITLGTVVPGIGFGSWLKTIIANLAVFPLTGFLISLSFIFLFLVIGSTFDNFLPKDFSTFAAQLGFGIPIVNTVTGALTNTGWPPLLIFGVKNTSTVVFLGASIIILFLTPKAADLIKGIIEGKPFAFGSAIEDAFGPARSASGMLSEKYRGRAEYLSKPSVPGSPEKERLLAQIFGAIAGKR